MINFDNHNITGMSYNGHMIRKAYGCDGNLVWSRTPEPYANKYFTFVSRGDGDFGIYRHVEAGSYDYSKDNGVTWSTISLRPSPSHRISVTNGDRVLLRAKFSDLYQWGDYGCAYITSTVPYDVEGNIMSLIFKDDFVGQISLGGRTATFRRFFDNETNLISAENLVLPATTLCKSCYQYMFGECTSLTTAPSILPAMTLTEWCYHDMFANCSSLTTAPELPATTLTDWCYTDMFNGCTNLNNVKCLATDISAYNCTYHWLENTSETGTFNRGENGSCNWTRDENGVPSGWTITPPCVPPFSGKWLATYADSRVFSGECDSTSAITNGEVTKENLVQIEIGECVTSIGDSAFSNASSLTSIKVWQTTPPTLGGTPFANTGNAPIYVPASSVDLYKNQWAGYASRIQPIQ